MEERARPAARRSTEFGQMMSQPSQQRKFFIVYR